MIITESNKYATQKGITLNLQQDELQAFFGMLLIMGFHTLRSLRLYWSTDQNFHVSRISSIMSQKRFLHILRYLHLNDNDVMPQRGNDRFDRLYKVRPLVDILNERFSSLYAPYRELSIDESMVAFKGRTTLKQYMPMKPVKRGFKDPREETSVLRTNTQGHREEITCPKAVADYNKYMLGVDKFDQLMSPYNVSWKSRRWWMKLFYFAFSDSAVVNSYILYSETKKQSKEKPISHLQYRSILELVS
nr:unnamed protein product [Callosobruchus analis]